jgi:hypothetical protein
MLTHTHLLFARLLIVRGSGSMAAPTLCRGRVADSAACGMLRGASRAHETRENQVIAARPRRTGAYGCLQMSRGRGLINSSNILVA